ncbi:MAG: dTDP-glucose 4,6-dehydratase [Methanocella sp. PtaU1.Bin125]|nr:MAG: dTDP-glucose 4,6-dehydratase [Methanocella sp. PtaU1.Bin125]
MAWKDKRVLITGARGFIGKYLAADLLRQGAKVTGLTVDGSAGEGAITWVTGDITTPASIKGLCRDVDVVFHLAAISNVDASIRDPVRTLNTNTFGTASLLEESRAGGVKKFVYVSSAHVYGVPQYLPIDERHPVVPREPYAASKIASEQIVQAYGNAYGLDYAILRPFNVFGAGQDPSFLIPGVIQQALKNGAIKVGNTDPTRDFLYVEDCVRGFICIADRGSGVFNIGSGMDWSIASVVQKIRDLIDPAIPIVSDESRMRAGKVEIPRLCADISKLRALGWKPDVGFEEGLARTIRANP